MLLTLVIFVNSLLCLIGVPTTLYEIYTLLVSGQDFLIGELIGRLLPVTASGAFLLCHMSGYSKFLTLAYAANLTCLMGFLFTSYGVIFRSTPLYIPGLIIVGLFFGLYAVNAYFLRVVRVQRKKATEKH